jgi:hypothetical protein
MPEGERRWVGIGGGAESSSIGDDDKRVGRGGDKGGCLELMMQKLKRLGDVRWTA